MATIKVIILDFDGVIVDSNQIKHQAFSELFKEYPEHYDEMMQYHLSHNHVNRHEKFRYVMVHILKHKYDKNIAEKWAEKFSLLTRKKIINCPYVGGALEFIKGFYGKIPLYIASATPQEELEIILKARGLLKYFKGVYGAPTPKLEIFAEITAKENIEKEEMFFVGDSPEDRDAAVKAGILFLGGINELSRGVVSARR